jgi:hypothetical protein
VFCGSHHGIKAELRTSQTSTMGFCIEHDDTRGVKYRQYGYARSNTCRMHQIIAVTTLEPRYHPRNGMYITQTRNLRHA